MKKITKIFFLTITIIIALIIISGFLVRFLINPDQFKSLIINQVYNTTGKTLNLKNGIHWTFYPIFGFEFKQATLKNKTSTTNIPFAKINDLKIGIKFLPLIYGTIETNQLYIDGLTINLIKDKNGRSNLGKKLQLALPIQAGSSQQQTQATTQAIKPARIHFATPCLHIKNAVINWQNLATGQNSTIKNFNLKIDYVAHYDAFPINLAFNFTNSQPNINGSVLFKGILRAHNEQLFQLNAINLQAQLINPSAPNENLNLKLTSELILTPRGLQTKLLQLTLNNIKLTGDVELVNLPKHHNLHFNLATNNIDFDQWHSFYNPKFSSSSWPDHLNIEGQLAIQHLQALNTSWGNFIKIFSLGKLQLNNNQPMQLQANNLQTNITINSKSIKYTTTQADIYNGKLQGNFALIMGNNKIPNISIATKFQNIELTQFLNSLANIKNLTGNGNLSIDLITQGNDTKSQLNNLTGHANFNLANFSVTNFCLLSFIQRATELTKQANIIPSNQCNDIFATANGNIKIKQGIISNQDFMALAPTIKLTGYGKLNLLTKYLSYSLDAISTEPQSLTPKPSIPIDIKGNINKLKININAQKFMHEFFHQRQNKLIHNFNLRNNPAITTY